MDARLKTIIKEVKDEFGISLKKTFLDEVDDPTPILRHMVNTSMNYRKSIISCWELGKRLQREEKYRGKIPFKAELETSAGLWYLIYEGEV